MTFIIKLSLPLAFAVCAGTALANEPAKERPQSRYVGLTDVCSGLIATFDKRTQTLNINKTDTATTGVFPVYMKDGTRKITICATADEIDSGIKKNRERLDKNRAQELEERRAMYRSGVRFIFAGLPKEQQTPEKMTEILEKEDRLAEEHIRIAHGDFEIEMKAWEEGARALREQTAAPNPLAP